MFDGDPTNYYNFVQSFTNLTEAKTADSKMRLHSWRCPQFNEKLPSNGTRKGIHRSTPSDKDTKSQLLIKNEDCNVLQKLSISLTNCNNILQDIGYLNKVDNPDSLQKIVRRLPHTLRRSWCDKADDIMSNEQ